MDVFRDYCLITSEKNPFILANILMHHPSVKIFGPEHHILVPIVILTTIRNNNYLKPSGQQISEKDINEVIARASKVGGGWCGFYGTCGSAIGSGIALSIFSEATPSTHHFRSIANRTTSASLNYIADELEHCCKRSVRYSIKEIINILKQEFNIELPQQVSPCEFSGNKHKCVHNRCPFYAH